ncbi:MAG: hypothetical protein ACOYIA_07465 [Eubacteriales bacterium]|jgi:hypothetical protein
MSEAIVVQKALTRSGSKQAIHITGALAAEAAASHSVTARTQKSEKTLTRGYASLFNEG